MALLKRKSKKEDSAGSEQQSAPEQWPQAQQGTASAGSSGGAPIGPGLERKWEEAWRRARAR